MEKMFAEELNNKVRLTTPPGTTVQHQGSSSSCISTWTVGSTNSCSYMYQWFTGSGNRAAVVSVLRNKYDREKDLRFPIS